MVLDHRDHPRRSSSSVDSVPSLDDQVDSSARSHSIRYRGLVRNALGYIGRREIQGETKDHCKATTFSVMV